MAVRTDRVYRFTDQEHWRAGARRNLELVAGQLRVPPALCVEMLPDEGLLDACAIPAIDTCGRPAWLRTDRMLVRREASGTVDTGELSGTAPVHQMVIGPTITWLLSDLGLERFNSLNLQLLDVIQRWPGWRPAAIAGDGGDGLWLAEVDATGATRLRHIDCWGRTCRSPIEIEARVGPWPVLASSLDGGRLALLDPIASDRLHIIDSAGDEPATEVGLDEIHHGVLTLMTIDSDDRIRLLTQNGPDDDGLQLQALALADGEVDGHQRLAAPPRLGAVTAIVADGQRLFVVTNTGLGAIGPCGGDGEVEPSTAMLPTFITPSLQSPRAAHGGWDRAEVVATLPPGTALEISWASTDDGWLIDAANRLLDGPQTAQTVADLERLLPWETEATVRYEALPAGQQTMAAPEALAALLDSAAGTTLWLRITLMTPVSRTPPAITGLWVHYPHKTYVDELPAAYRQDERSAAQLRRILAPFEVLYDQLDRQLASLPDRIAPATAPADWTTFLLGWLGYPPLGDLAPELRRLLLARAARLLEQRGTGAAVDAVLDVITGGRATVVDTATEPAGWFLTGADDSAPAARLSRDTMVLAQQPPPSRPGAMVLGTTPVGHGCNNPSLVLADRARTVTVRLDLDPEQRQALEPIIDRLLRAFVPAHVRLLVLYSDIDGQYRARRLDEDLRLGPPTDDDDRPLGGERPHDALLYSDAHWQLGSTARPGSWHLPSPQYRPAILDRNTVPEAEPRLN